MAFQILLSPFTFALRKIYGLDRVKDEAVRVINILIGQPLYEAKNYKVRFHVFKGFSIRHRKTNEALGSISVKYSQVNFENIQAPSQFFPSSFASENSKILQTRESLHFWYVGGRVTTAIAQISVDPIYVPRISHGIDEDPYHNTIKILMNGRLEISRITKEVWDTSEMYGNVVETIEYGHCTPLDKIFILSNKFVNEKTVYQLKGAKQLG